MVFFYFEGKVEIGFKLIGKSVEENGFCELKDLFLVEIICGDKCICVVILK